MSAAAGDLVEFEEKVEEAGAEAAASESISMAAEAAGVRLEVEVDEVPEG